MKKILFLLAGVLVQRSLFAAPASIEFDLQNTGSADYPGGSSLVSVYIRSSYPPNDWNGGETDWPMLPAIAAGATYHVVMNTSGNNNIYPQVDYLVGQITAGGATAQIPVAQAGYNASAYATKTVVFDYGAHTIGLNTPPPPSVYTNFVLCANNTMSETAIATWTYNGVIVKQEPLTPGASDCWTTPNIKISPPPADSVSFGVTVVPTWQMLGNTNNSDYFSPIPGGTNFNFTGSVTNYAVGKTNTVSGGANDTVQAQTNNPIVWQPSVGTASESTLKSGFEATYAANKDIFSGLGILNKTLGDGVMAITNSLGQQVALLYSNIDGVHQVFKAITNLSLAGGGTVTNSSDIPLLGQIATNTASEPVFTGMMTNQLGQVITYQAIITNELLQIVNAITNNPPNPALNSISNSFAQMLDQTNADIARETTLAGISNLLATPFPTNNAPATNDGGFAAMLATNNPDFSDLASVLAATNIQVELGGETNYGDAAVASGTASSVFGSAESRFAAFVAEMSPLDIDDNFSPGDMTYTFGAGGSAHLAKALNTPSWTIDFNPLNNPQIAPLFGWSKALWTWGLAIAYMLKCVNDTTKVIELMEMGRGVVVSSPVTKKTFS